MSKRGTKIDLFVLLLTIFDFLLYTLTYACVPPWVLFLLPA
jgi:hypothetical protein